MKTRLNLKRRHTHTYTHALHSLAASPSRVRKESLPPPPRFPHPPRPRVPAFVCLLGWGMWTRASCLGTGAKLEDGGSVSLREIR